MTDAHAQARNSTFRIVFDEAALSGSNQILLEYTIDNEVVVSPVHNSLDVDLSHVNKPSLAHIDGDLTFDTHYDAENEEFQDNGSVTYITAPVEDRDVCSVQNDMNDCNISNIDVIDNLEPDLQNSVMNDNGRIVLDEDLDYDAVTNALIDRAIDQIDAQSIEKLTQEILEDTRSEQTENLFIKKIILMENEAPLEEIDFKDDSPRVGIKAILHLQKQKEKSDSLNALCEGYSPTGIHQRLAAYAFKRNTKPLIIHDVSGELPNYLTRKHHNTQKTNTNSSSLSTSPFRSVKSPYISSPSSSSKSSPRIEQKRIRDKGLDGLGPSRGFLVDCDNSIKSPLLPRFDTSNNQSSKNASSRPQSATNSSNSVSSPLSRRQFRTRVGDSANNNTGNHNSSVLCGNDANSSISGSSLRASSLTPRECMRLNTRNSPGLPCHKYSQKNEVNFQKTAQAFLSVGSLVKRSWSHVLPVMYTANGSPVVDIRRHIPSYLLGYHASYPSKHDAKWKNEDEIEGDLIAGSKISDTSNEINEQNDVLNEDNESKEILGKDIDNMNAMNVCGY